MFNLYRPYSLLNLPFWKIQISKVRSMTRSFRRRLPSFAFSFFLGKLVSVLLTGGVRTFLFGRLWWLCFVLEHICDEEKHPKDQQKNNYFEFYTQFRTNFVMFFSRMMTHQQLLDLLELRLFFLFPLRNAFEERRDCAKEFPSNSVFDFGLPTVFKMYFFIGRGVLTPFFPFAFGSFVGIEADVAGSEFIFGLDVEFWGSFVATGVPHFLLFSVGVEKVEGYFLYWFLLLLGYCYLVFQVYLFSFVVFLKIRFTLLHVVRDKTLQRDCHRLNHLLLVLVIGQLETVELASRGFCLQHQFEGLQSWKVELALKTTALKLHTTIGLNLRLFSFFLLDKGEFKVGRKWCFEGEPNKTYLNEILKLHHILNIT